MTSSSVKKLFRRCLLLVIISVATGCTTLKQMPSSPVVVQERSFNTPTTKLEMEFPSLQLPSAQPEITPLVSKVPDNDFVLETPAKDSKLIEYISTKFKLSVKASSRIVELATKYAHEKFPKRNDILAIIAIESSFDTMAKHKGSHGLMQIERTSHLKSIKGRNLNNPEVNIEIGSKILNDYFGLVNFNKRSAILSFNAGIGNFKKGRYNSRYYSKYSKELRIISSM